MAEPRFSTPEDPNPWAHLGEVPGAADDISQEILRELKPWVETGAVSVESGNQAYFDLLESKYPIGLNRIEWRAVIDHLVVDVLDSGGKEISGKAHEERLAEYRDVLMQWFTTSGIAAGDRAVWVGDGCELSLHMSVATLLECFPIVFTYPQHSYVCPANAAWCLSYTMEGQLFLGKANKALASGPIDFESLRSTEGPG